MFLRVVTASVGNARIIEIILGMIADGFKNPVMEYCTVLQLSWLERYTDNVEVGSSTLPGTT